jgi:hypothetical protein
MTFILHVFLVIKHSIPNRQGLLIDSLRFSDLCGIVLVWILEGVSEESALSHVELVLEGLAEAYSSEAIHFG